MYGEINVDFLSERLLEIMKSFFYSHFIIGHGAW